MKRIVILFVFFTSGLLLTSISIGGSGGGFGGISEDGTYDPEYDQPCEGKGCDNCEVSTCQMFLNILYFDDVIRGGSPIGGSLIQLPNWYGGTYPHINHGNSSRWTTNIRDINSYYWRIDITADNCKNWIRRYYVQGPTMFVRIEIPALPHLWRMKWVYRTVCDPDDYIRGSQKAAAKFTNVFYGNAYWCNKRWDREIFYADHVNC